MKSHRCIQALCCALLTVTTYGYGLVSEHNGYKGPGEEP